ncbi:MAG: TolC family protein, partial [Candidatus Omnitrophica bacterium]|nr:TolC family protein [Candidatus Omnitrophota bacterium]
IMLAQAGYRPQINASANYFYISNDMGRLVNHEQNNWNAGVAVTIPIFDGFSSKAKVDEAKARYTEAKLDKDNIVEMIAVEVREACLNMEQAESIVQSQRDNLEQAKEALYIAEISYDNGVAINLDVLDAQTSLGQVQKNLAEGIYDYLMAQAALDRTMGKSYIEEANDGKKV